MRGARRVVMWNSPHHHTPLDPFRLERPLSEASPRGLGVLKILDTAEYVGASM
jgi:hypothetical protein